MKNWAVKRADSWKTENIALFAAC